ncbi:Calcium/calmodulin-dependent/calcium-dependent protein kinase [Phytophthora cactorum]|nr:Calcium/calmodulin-dependent/calcium-dependent protein kinase [Phytophthora cactorum]
MEDDGNHERWFRADVWSLGCAVLEMITGHSPWQQFSNPLTAMYQSCPVIAPTIPADVPAETASFLKLCLQRNPEHRGTITQLLAHPFVRVATDSKVKAKSSKHRIKRLGEVQLGNVTPVCNQQGSHSLPSTPKMAALRVGKDLVPEPEPPEDSSTQSYMESPGRFKSSEDKRALQPSELQYARENALGSPGTRSLAKLRLSRTPRLKTLEPITKPMSPVITNQDSASMLMPSMPSNLSRGASAGSKRLPRMRDLTTGNGLDNSSTSPSRLRHRHVPPAPMADTADALQTAQTGVDVRLDERKMYVVEWADGAAFGFTVTPVQSDRGTVLCLARRTTSNATAGLQDVVPGDMLIAIGEEKVYHLGPGNATKLLRSVQKPVRLTLQLSPYGSAAKDLPDLAPNDTPAQAYYSTFRKPLAEELQMELPELGEGEYDFLWEYGSLGLVVGTSAEGLPYVRSFTGKGTSKQLSQVQENDEIVLVNNRSAQEYGFHEIMQYIMNVPKPAVIRFRRPLVNRAKANSPPKLKESSSLPTAQVAAMSIAAPPQPQRASSPVSSMSNAGAPVRSHSASRSNSAASESEATPGLLGYRSARSNSSFTMTRHQHSSKYQTQPQQPVQVAEDLRSVKQLQARATETTVISRSPSSSHRISHRHCSNSSRSKTHRRRSSSINNRHPVLPAAPAAPQMEEEEFFEIDSNASAPTGRQGRGLPSSLNHPNIIKLCDVFDGDGPMCFLVMEYAEGGELFDRIIAKEYYTEAEAKKVVKVVAKVLRYCHSEGVTHRDLKPENLLYADETESAVIKIADFGFAKLVTEETNMSTMCGTPGYYAPEIVRKLPYDSKCDIWSLGVIAYILLCGFPPFYDENQVEEMRKVGSGCNLQQREENRTDGFDVWFL